MRVGLIDVDGHNFPNLCLMKISAYHKSRVDHVEWYLPLMSGHMDRVYLSKVFSFTPDFLEVIDADEVIKGGTGYAIKEEGGREVYHKELDGNLPSEIEHIYPDYSIYPQYTGWGKKLNQQTAFGFLTRGCPRGCDFCHVAPKEGRCSVKVADLDEFWRGQGNICLSDPNILACKDAPELMQQLILSGAKIDFNQGLDARLITEDRAELLANMKLKLPHFAMDKMSDIDAVKRGLKLYVSAWKRAHKNDKRGSEWNYRKARVFCLTNFDTSHEEDMERIRAIQECECQPFVMIYNKPSAPQITRRLQRWTNNPWCYSQAKSFEDYIKFTYKGEKEK